MSDTWDGRPENPDDAPAEVVLNHIRRCARSWEPDARIIGNVRAKDILRVCLGLSAEIAARERQAREQALREAAVVARVAHTGKGAYAAILALIEKEPAP